MKPIVPFKRNHACVGPNGKIISESPNAHQALVDYLNHQNTKSLDPIRIVVTNVPSKAKTKR